VQGTRASTSVACERLRELDLAAARQAAGAEGAAGARLRNHDRGACLAPQFLQLTHRLLDRLLGGGPEFGDRFGERLRRDLEAERKRADLGEDLRVAHVDHRSRGVRRTVRLDRCQAADGSDFAIREYLFAVQRRRVHLRVGCFGLWRIGHGFLETMNLEYTRLSRSSALRRRYETRKPPAPWTVVRFTGRFQELMGRPSFKIGRWVHMEVGHVHASL